MAIITYGWPPADIYCERCTEANPGSGRVAFHAPPDCYSAERAELDGAEKVRHVLRARQTRKHGCHWPGCRAQVPPAMWGCKRHWRELPKSYRDRVWALYAPGQEERMDPSDAYMDLMYEIDDWIQARDDMAEYMR
jgi:hypothetical protein